MGNFPQTGVELVAKGLSAFLGALNEGNTAVKGFVKGTSEASVSSRAFGEIITGALRQVGAMAVNALGQATRAVTGFVKDSLGLAGDFESGMLQFQSVAGKSVDTSGLEQFKQLFLDIGKELPVSTSDVQKAAIEMVKGGIDPATIAAGGLRQNIQFASAAMGGDLVAAAETSSKILGGWISQSATAADKSDFLAKATDLLTKAANASSVDVHELSLGLFNAQGVAKNAGVSFEDLTTTLAELAPRFASSSEAGNSVKNMLSRLQPTTKSAIAAFEGLGLVTEDGGNKFYTAEGKFVGFEKASQLLQDSLAGLTNQQRQQVLQTMFGMDAMNAASGLAELGAKGYQDMTAALENANGVQLAAQTTQQGYNTAMDNASGSVEALKITLGTHLLPVITTLMNDYIAPGINSLTTFAEKFLNLVPSIMASDNPLQTFINALRVAAPNMLDLINHIQDIKDTLVGFAEGVKPFVTVIQENLTPILAGLGTAITALLIPSVVSAGVAFAGAAIAAAPLVLTITGIGVAGALLVKGWTENWGGIQEKTQAVWDYLQPVFLQVQNWLEVNIPKAVQVVSAYWTDTLWPALQKVWSFIDTNVLPILDVLASVALAELKVEVAAGAALWSNVLWPALKAVGDFIGNTLIPIISVLVDVNLAVLQKASEALAGFWQKVLQPALEAAGTYLNATLGPAVKSLGDWFNNNVVPALKAAWDWLTKVTGGFSGVGSAIDSVIGGLSRFADGVRNLKLPDWLTPGSPTPWEIALRSLGDTLGGHVVPNVNVLSAALDELGPQFSTAGKEAIDRLGRALTESTLPSKSRKTAKDVMTGFADGVNSYSNLATDAIRKSGEKAIAAMEEVWKVESPSKITFNIGVFAAQGLIEGLVGMFPQLDSVIRHMGSVLTGGIDHVSKDVQDKIDEMIKSATQAVNDAKKGLADIVIGGLGAQASTDRQKMSNMDELSKLSDKSRAEAKAALDKAEAEASKMRDAKQGAEYYAQRSRQIFELASLKDQLEENSFNTQRDHLQAAFNMQKSGLDFLKQQQKDNLAELTKAQGSGDTARAKQLQAQADYYTVQVAQAQQKFDAAQEALQRGPRIDDAQRSLQERYQLLLDAQKAEGQQQQLQFAQGSDTSKLLDSMQALMTSLITSGAQDTSLVDAIGSLITQLSSLPATLAQMASQPSQGSTTTNTTNFNMPIYSNNSPAALQQSMAIAKAGVMS